MILSADWYKPREIIEDGQVCINICRQRLRRTMGFHSDQGKPFRSRMASATNSASGLSTTAAASRLRRAVIKTRVTEETLRFSKWQCSAPAK
jgi:hypothetical protein